MEKREFIKYIKTKEELIYLDISARISELLTSYSKLIIAIETRKGINEMIADFKAHAEPLLAYLKLLFPKEVETLRNELDNLNSETEDLRGRARQIVDKIMHLSNSLVKIVREKETGVGI